MVNVKKVKLLLVGAMLAFTTVIAYQQTAYLIMSREAAKPETRDPAPAPVVEAPQPSMKYDVILNSYMRSGSTIVGKILGFRNDTFYFYEPFWKKHKWEYVSGPNKLCKYLNYQCKNLTEPGRSDDSMSAVLSEDLAYLNSIYDCEYPSYARNIDTTLHGQFGGPKWMSFYECSSQENADRTKCLEADVHHCREASHRASKVLRLTLDNLTPLLEQRPNLKIIHLFRDPRGIFNSHWTTKWFPLYKTNISRVIRDDVMTLCNRMMYDIIAAKQMKKQFPDRFRLVQYEDFEDILNKSGRLFEFVGMSYTQADRDQVDLISRSAKSQMSKITSKRLPEFKFVPNAWRQILPWSHINIIDSLCKDVYKELGYKAFASKEAFIDLANPSMDASLPYAL